MYYIGIDGSTTSTGIGVFNDKHLVYYENIKPKSKDWCERVSLLGKRLNEILKDYPQIEEAYVEDIPLKDGKLTILKLGSVRGAIATICELNNVKLFARKVNEWRQDAGFFDGTKDGMRRKTMKKKAVLESKRLFNIEVNDDVAEGCLIGYYSKYPNKVKPKSFGKGVK